MTTINNSYEDLKITTLASKFLEMILTISIKAKKLCLLINPQSNSLSFTILIFLVIASYNNFKWWAKLSHPLENMNSTSKLQVANHFKILIFSTAVVSQYFDIRKKKCIMVEALYLKKKGGVLWYFMLLSKSRYPRFSYFRNRSEMDPG